MYPTDHYQGVSLNQGLFTIGMMEVEGISTANHKRTVMNINYSFRMDDYKKPFITIHDQIMRLKNFNQDQNI